MVETERCGQNWKNWQTDPWHFGSVSKTVTAKQKVGRQHRFVAEIKRTGRRKTWLPNATERIGKCADETELAARQTTLPVRQYATGRQD